MIAAGLAVIALAGCVGSPSDGAPSGGKDAATFTLAPDDADATTDAVVAGTVALLAQRFAADGATVTADGQDITVAFPPGAPVPAATELTTPTVVDLRPVLAIGSPEPAGPQPPPDAGPAEPTSASDTAFYLTAEVLAAFSELDCTDPAAVPFTSSEGALVTCQADRSATYVLGPVEVPGDAVAIAKAKEADDTVLVTLDPEGARTFADVTARLTSLAAPLNQVAITVDGRVASAPTVMSAITDGALQITSGDAATSPVVAQLLYGRDGATWHVVEAR